MVTTPITKAMVRCLKYPLKSIFPAVIRITGSTPPRRKAAIRVNPMALMPLPLIPHRKKAVIAAIAVITGYIIDRIIL